jgi:hypothetical protein
MKTQKLLITPDLASQMLQNNIKNRNVKQPVVDRYAKDIIEGRWKEDTAEMIKISKTGIVLDGQHRLHAIIKANKGINLHLATDLEDSIFDVLDTGSVRSAGDVFTISQIKCGFKIAAIISAYEVLKIGSLHGTSVQKQNKKTNSELLAIYLENPNFWDEVSKKSTSWYDHFGMILSTSTIGSFYAYMYENRPDLAADFFDQLTGKKNITNATIFVLRNKLFKDKLSTYKLTSQYKNALIIKTWNAFVTNREIKILKFDAEVEKTPSFVFL